MANSSNVHFVLLPFGLIDINLIDNSLIEAPILSNRQSQIQTPTRLRRSSEGQLDLCQMTLATPAVYQRWFPTLAGTLQRHRDLARLSMMHPIVHHLVDIPVEPYLTPSTSVTRGHDSYFFQIRTSNTAYKQSFFPRTVILWNQLPQTAVSKTTLAEPADHPHNKLYSRISSKLYSAVYPKWKWTQNIYLCICQADLNMKNGLFRYLGN